MKKIIITMAAIAAAFTMASCSKELVEQEENATAIEGNSIITASTECSLTKTALSGNDTDGYDVVWSEGDEITIGGNTFTLIDGAGTTSGKFLGTLPEGDGPFTAYYPATYSGTDWPASQTYTEGNITGSPMTAKVEKGAESISFTNAGGILRLTLKGTDKIRRITVKADGLDEISLSYDGGVTLDNDGTVFHIAMPEGEYSGTSITIYTIDFNHCTKKLKADTKLNIERSKITTASFTVSFPSSDSTDPLTGAFSIADGKQICFSRGNLYYDEGFKFESKQCAIHGYEFYSKTWGLFGWSTSATNYGMNTSQENSSYSGDFVDWGKAIGDGKTWRTLSKDEWVYLLETRTDASQKYGYARVYGTYGIIILPDEFTDPMKNNGSKAFVPGMGSTSSNVYALGGNWEAMESAGAVFLPIAGYRGGSDVYGNQDYGMYWSSSASDAEKAYYLDFQASRIVPANSDGRRFGLSVRLVMDVCTVTFDMNGKEGTAPESLKLIPFGSTITKPSDPTAEGYALKGWYKDMACTDKWDFETDEVTANTTLYAGWAIIPDEALSGLFTVNSSGKQVFISKGNLYAKKESSAWEWHFYDGQYKFNSLTTSDERTASDSDNEIDLFTWGYSASTSLEPTGSNYVTAHTSKGDTLVYDKPSSDGGDDWGVAYCESNKIAVGTWRTLSIEEWMYLFNSHSYKWVTVNGINGYVVAPDGFAGTLSDSYADDSALASDNLVFLPAAGYRYGSKIYYIDYLVGSYWSSSVSYWRDEAYYWYLDDTYVDDFSRSSSNGYSVRLVTDCE